jgi:hypothetical protein
LEPSVVKRGEQCPVGREENGGDLTQPKTRHGTDTKNGRTIRQ